MQQSKHPRLLWRLAILCLMVPALCTRAGAAGDESRKVVIVTGPPP